MIRSRRAVALAVLFVLQLTAASAVAQGVHLHSSAVPLADVLEVLVVNRDVIALDTIGRSIPSARLRLGEIVYDIEARGAVGLVLTDRRALAVAAEHGVWQTVRLRTREGLPERFLLGDRLAISYTTQRVLGFDGARGLWLQAELGRGERVLEVRAGANTAVVVTSRRVLGLSADSGGFFEVSLHVGEELERVSVRSTLATVITSERVLIFDGPSGGWSRRNLDRALVGRR